MTNKYRLYRIIYPFSSKAQWDLKESRRGHTLESFTDEFEQGPMRSAVAAFLWDYIRRELALVPDFKPAASDSLSKLYGLHFDEFWDDILEPLFARCGIDVNGMSFEGYDPSKIDTLIDVYRFVTEVASRLSA